MQAAGLVQHPAWYHADAEDRRRPERPPSLVSATGASSNAAGKLKALVAVTSGGSVPQLGAGASAAGGAPRARCRGCGHPLIRCRTPGGVAIAVDPTPIPGGELVINGVAGVVVAVLSCAAAASVRRRGELGFVPHTRVCGRTALCQRHAKATA